MEIINGQIVIKESSLVSIRRGFYFLDDVRRKLFRMALQEIANQDSLIAEGEYEEVEEGIHASSRYSSFLNKRKSKSWSIEETRLFYKVRFTV